MPFSLLLYVAYVAFEPYRILVHDCEVWIAIHINTLQPFVWGKMM